MPQHDDTLDLPLADEQPRQIRKKTAKKKRKKKRRPGSVEESPVRSLPGDEDLGITDVAAALEQEDSEEGDSAVDALYDENLGEPFDSEDVVRVPVSEEQAEAHRTLPEPREGPATPIAQETVQTLTLPAAKSDSPVGGPNARWDEFLLRLSEATRMGVWELGIDALTGTEHAFAGYSREDLVQPRGRLTEGQTNEISSLLEEFGLKLSKAGKHTQLRGGLGGGRGITRAGIRTPGKMAPPDSGASLGERHNYRLSKMRLTM